MTILRLATLVCVVLSASGQASFASPLGFWLAKDGAIIRIEPCGSKPVRVHCTSQSITRSCNWTIVKDKNNTDPAKRNRPLVGVQVLISMQPNGASKWSGQVYNDDNGRTYSGNLIELGPSTIKIEGCWLMICGGEELVRVK